MSIWWPVHSTICKIIISSSVYPNFEYWELASS